MTLEEAKTFLNSYKREELRDRAFGDAEVYWMDGDEQVASGYFGAKVAEVSVGDTVFVDNDADELRGCGARGRVERNDSTGPDEYREGECVPGVSLEGVLKELTEE